MSKSHKPIPGLNGRIVRCILFDLGDTLWSRKDMHVWQQTERAANIRAVALLRQYVDPSLLPNVPEAALGKRLRDAVEEHLRKLIRQDPGVEPDSLLVIEQVLQQWGITELDRSKCEAIFEALRIRIPESRPLFDDVLSTLATLRQRGFLLGVVTNRQWGGKLFQEDLQTLGLLDHFDTRHLAISADLGVRKPNPAIFLHALNALDVSAEHAAMVGDSLLSDIVGGKMLGMFTIWKPKPAVRDQARLIASGAATRAGHGSTSPDPESSTEHSPDDLPPGIHITDDDYVLAQVQSDANQWHQHLHGEVKPDLIIENLSDLLDIFTEAGKQ